MANYHDEILNFEKIAKEHTEYMRNSINLIASENVTSVEVTEALATDFAHRYAEGQAFERFYEGCQYVDLVEDKTKKLSCKVYDCDYANVQPVSGVTANLAAFFGFAKPGEKVMALEVPSGGHISHADVSAAGIRGLKTVFHPLDKNVMNIDIDAMNKKILEEKPKIVLFGGSLFLFPHPIKEAREAADEVGATIMYDGAHVLGLIAGGQFQQPLKEGADVMMGSTHKTFPGPQGGIILSHKENEELIDNAVFPGVVSNHHLHHLLGLGIATAEMLEFGEAYAKQTIKNAQALGQAMYERGFDVLCEDLGFTQSHQIAVDLTAIPGDNRDNSDDPSGIRIGTQEITRRGLKEKEMDEVAEFIKRVAVDKEDIADEVAEFMNQYTVLDYAFSDREAYQYHRLD